MSFGNSYNGGRTRMGTKVIVNVYDLSPANEYLYPIGFGLHHSGVEILGVEYSFGSGGGIFECIPKEGAPNAKFRYSIEMGSFDGGQQELNHALDYLRSNPNDTNHINNRGTGFIGTNYNLITKNCNHFSNALVWRLLRKPIPSHINRLADLGTCCSCFLPKQLLEDAPVGGSGNNNNSSSSSSGISRFPPSMSTMQRDSSTSGGTSSSSVFTGTGHRLTTDDNTSSSSSSATEGLLSKWTKSSPTRTSDDLTDRRERARKAALARLERNQHQSSD